MVSVEITIVTTETDPNARYHGKSVDESLDAVFWDTQPEKVFTISGAGFTHTQTVEVAEGSHYVIYGNSAGSSYPWYAQIFANGTLVAEGDVTRYSYLRGDFTTIAPEPEGVTINAMVTPAKAGFLVWLQWLSPTGWMDIEAGTTDAAGRKTWLYYFTSYPQTVRIYLPAGQVIDGVEYGEYTSDQVTLYDTQIGNLYLYPEAVGPDEPYTQVTDFIIPESLPAGASIGELTVVTRNAGTAAGYLEVVINSERYTEVIGNSYPTQVALGDTFNFYLTLGITSNMPNEDFTLTATNYDGTSYITKTILLQVGIPTTTTITIPDKVGVDEKFIVSGILYETESGIPIPNQPINHSYNGKTLGSSITGIDGDYLKEVSIPEAGVWSIKSEFPGTEALQTSRALANAVVAATPIETALLIAGPIVTGLALIMYGTI